MHLMIMTAITGEMRESPPYRPSSSPSNELSIFIVRCDRWERAEAKKGAGHDPNPLRFRRLLDFRLKPVVDGTQQIH